MTEIKEAGQRDKRRARRLPPAERRAQLLDCAIAAFAEHGAAGTGHAQVARLAGVSVPTVFVYFPSKEELVRAVLEEVGRVILEDVLRPVVGRSGSASETLIGIALAFADFCRAQPDHARVWLDWSTSFRDELWSIYATFQNDVVALISGVVDTGKSSGELDPALDTEDAARLLVATAHMLAQMQFTGQPREKVEHFLRSLIDGYAAHTHGG